MESSMVYSKSCVMKSESSEGDLHSSKNFEKKRKKFLTKLERCDKLKQFEANGKTGSLNASVPCKLNNVKTIFNTLDN